MTIGADLLTISFSIFDAPMGLEKVASKWKRMLGELSSTDRQRLLDTGILDYGRETTGLKRGTENILNRLGITVSDADIPSLVKSLKTSVQEKSISPVAKSLQDVVVTSGLGGLVALPGQGRILKGNLGKFTKGLSSDEAEASKALVMRHEADEMRAAQKAAKKAGLFGTVQQFRPGKLPESLQERASVKINEGTVAGLKKLKEINPLDANISAAYDRAKAALPKQRGTVLSGLHMSPEVILRESQNVQALPPAVTKQMLPFRKGEMHTMGPLGFEYGKAPSVQQSKDIMKAFKREEI